jgi:hypothetical protein
MRLFENYIVLFLVSGGLLWMVLPIATLFANQHPRPFGFTQNNLAA